MVSTQQFLAVGLCFLGTLAPLSRAADASAPADGVSISRQSDRLRVEIDGRLFTEYRFAEVSRPCLYPLLGPGDTALTRRWPLEPSENEEHDHPHHRSVWYAHGNVNGQDFWSEEEKAGRIVHAEFLEIKSGKDTGVIRSRNRWVARDGTVVCTDERAVRFFRPAADSVWFDFDIKLIASEGDAVFGDTKEGTMAIRLAETMRLKPNRFNEGRPTGHILSSSGARDDSTWGKPAAWVDYSGPVNAETFGVAIFDHPANPRHPTWWHVRDYGLFAANPFGVHDFEKKPAGTGDLRIPAGQQVVFRYRFLLHRGDAEQARVAERYQKYASQPPAPAP
jgi:hypothetical protein